VLTIITSPKGGSGVSVCAAAIAGAANAVLVDLDGDQPALLGTSPDATSTTVAQWMAPTPPPKVAEPGTLITRGDNNLNPGDADGWTRCARRLDALAMPVVVDAGCSTVPTALTGIPHQIFAVLRPCYLALHRWYRQGHHCTGVIVVDEPGRALGVDDVVRCVGAPLVAHVRWDPAIARAVDAGLLGVRRPATLAVLDALATRAL